TAEVVEPSHPTRLCVSDWFIHPDLPQCGLRGSPSDEVANYSRGQPIGDESDSWNRIVWSWNMGHRAKERPWNRVGCHVCVVPIGRSSDAGESVRSLLKTSSLHGRLGAGRFNWRKIPISLIGHNQGHAFTLWAQPQAITKSTKNQNPIRGVPSRN